jgi:glycerol-3-phosphate acyltransferase PlsX
MIKVALDAMGGDNAPVEIIAGADLARNTTGVDITLVGDTQKIEESLAQLGSKSRFPVVHTSEVVSMGDHPSDVLRKKKDASIFVATRLVAEGRCDAVVSAGSTGAQMAGAIFILGRFKGIDRPGIGQIIPNINGGYGILCDAGAVADCKPVNLIQFALMANAYAKSAMGIENPRVALLNIGEEEEKGSELAQETYKLLKKADLNFIGNIESKDIVKGTADVFVSDGFTGNIVLKTIEGVATSVMKLVKKAATENFTGKLGGLLLKKNLSKVKKMFDYAEYGGAPLLGVNGISIISHGRSNRIAIKSAIIQAARCVENDLVGKIRQAID